eukprot:SAG31_NODE_4204_length_3475_cov_2.244076_1_plen_61_part_10
MAAGEDSIAQKLTQMANDQIEYLEANAVKVYREVVCPRKDLTGVTMTAKIYHDPDDPMGNY